MTNKHKHCSYCGKEEHYARGLCRACYLRQKRNGTLEYQYHYGPRPELWSDTTKQVLAQFKDGIKQNDIARNLGISRQLVSSIILRRAEKTNYYKLTHMKIEEMAEWFVANGHGGTKESWFKWLKEVDDDGQTP